MRLSGLPVEQATYGLGRVLILELLRVDLEPDALCSSASPARPAFESIEDILEGRGEAESEAHPLAHQIVGISDHDSDHPGGIGADVVSHAAGSLICNCDSCCIVAMERWRGLAAAVAWKSLGVRRSGCARVVVHLVGLDGARVCLWWRCCKLKDRWKDEGVRSDGTRSLADDDM